MNPELKIIFLKIIVKLHRTYLPHIYAKKYFITSFQVTLAKMPSTQLLEIQWVKTFKSQKLIKVCGSQGGAPNTRPNLNYALF